MIRGTSWELTDRVKEKYPKCHEKIVQQFNTGFLVEMRDLYEFFDEQGFRLSVIPCSVGYYCQLHRVGTSGSLVLSKQGMFELQCAVPYTDGKRWVAEAFMFEACFIMYECHLTE